MELLISRINSLRNSELASVVGSRLNEFETIGRSSDDELFNELCFCILTANFQAEKSIKIQKWLGNGFSTLSEEELAEKLKILGHRFPNTRAKFIVEARKHKSLLRGLLQSLSEKDSRVWLAGNVKGLGFKEASHFLRNVGFKNLAILDFHIIDIMHENNLIERPKNLSKKNYLEIERILEDFGRTLGLNMSELDLYLWYLETGKILK